MDQRQRLAVQRELAHEAIGKLRAIQEYFGVETSPTVYTEFVDFEDKLNEFETWLFELSPIA